MALTAVCIFQTPIGPVGVEEEGRAITRIFFAREGKEQECGEKTPLLSQAGEELAEYFNGRRTAFTLPLNPRGTEFQKKVWQALRDIPYGETRTYGQIAEVVGNPKACRAVGMANHHNPIAIVVPCHRVIGANGTLTGYAGGVSIKEQLLKLENREN